MDHMQGLALGFIGLGAMGRPMAKRLLEHGYRLTVYDVLPDRTRELVKLGAAPSTSPRAVAAASEVLITMLPDSPDVQAAVYGPEGVISGLRQAGILIEMSTIAPSVTRTIAKAVGAVGGRMLDAPVGRTSRHAEEGDLLIMVGGERNLLDEVEPILRCFGKDLVYCGPVGTGETMKLVNNLLTTTIVAANAEALTLGVKAGLELDTMLSVLRSTAASNTHLRSTYAEKALRRDFTPGFATRLAVKDLQLALGMAADHRLPAGVGAAALQLFTMARARGHDGDDYTSVITVLEELAGVELCETQKASAVG
jgi:3-hydroxyisobutyrate dehydrogenase-like beta-hydroxyacid dehydrogenase